MASERVQRRIDIPLDEADQAIAQSDWSVVRDRAQNVLALDPDNGDAATFLAAADRALANGRYQVERFLGEGGKKKIYLAQDTTPDREVAFALIKTIWACGP